MSSDQASEIVHLVAVDPLQKIFKETEFFDSIDALADVARGEHASFQFVVRSSQLIRRLNLKLIAPSATSNWIKANCRIGFVGYTRTGRPVPNPSKDRLSPLSGFYPDPIIDSTPSTLEAFTTQPIWLTVAIPREIDPGEYSCQIQLSGILQGKTFLLKRLFKIKVYPVTIDRTSLWVTNWFTLDKNQMKKLSSNRDSVLFSEAYWRWLKLAAAKMKEYDQNVILTPLFYLTGIDSSNGTFHFDFSRLDRFIQTFLDEGTLLRIEGGHLGGRMGNWYSQFGLAMPFWNHDTLRIRNLPLSDSLVQRFYKSFIPSLMSHLEIKGWNKIYLQHICDEPEAGNERSYAEIATFIKSLAPGIHVIEAVHSHGVDNTVDVWVPQLDFFDIDYDFYKQEMAAGDEVWFYTCLAPQGEYANRFIELPLIKTRLLHWINFRFGATGYLHWGWNFWNANPMEETSGIITESGNIMPGGDAFITYPGRGEILSSIRLEAMRDGIVDYELLKMLEKKRPQLAQEICRQVIYGFQKYDLDIASFRAKRRQILQWLSS